ncbi:MAG TPA: hypothetical protein VK845_11970 [Gemmatimonadales bacterium]|nr:hypothetical protein [Gemmatimonadales bacterium]
MDDIRWFAPNDYTRLILSDLRNRGSIDHHRASRARFFQALVPLLDC